MYKRKLCTKNNNVREKATNFARYNNEQNMKYHEYRTYTLYGYFIVLQVLML